MQSDVEVAKKLEESGIFCLYFGDFAEDHYMGRAEWMELVGAFIGKEQKAQDYMKENEKGINEIIARTEKIKDKPNVLWFTHSSQAPHWNLRTDKDYVNSIVSAVGGKLYAPESDKNSVTLSNEDFLKYMMSEECGFDICSDIDNFKNLRDFTDDDKKNYNFALENFKGKYGLQ